MVIFDKLTFNHINYEKPIPVSYGCLCGYVFERWLPEVSRSCYYLSPTTMKRTLLLLMVFVVVSSAAQRQSRRKEPVRRSMPVVIIDDKGRPYDAAEVFASIRSDGSERKFNRVYNDTQLKVAEVDTIDLFVNNRYFEFVATGLGTLFVSINVPYMATDDSVSVIEPIVVSAIGPRMMYRAGQLVAADSYAGNSFMVPLRKGQSLSSALEWRGVWRSATGGYLIRNKPAIIVVDGSVGGSISSMDDVEAIVVHRDAGTINFFAGMHGGGANYGGVIEIVTKRGVNQKKRR